MDFLKFKAEQREYLEKKLHLQGKIESMQREFDFIQRLSCDEVAYIMERKRELAATKIQRCYRRYMTRRQREAEMARSKMR